VHGGDVVGAGVEDREGGAQAEDALDGVARRGAVGGFFTRRL
jgi:hypothetical protein